MPDNINHPKHYNAGPIETIAFVDQVCSFYPGDEASSVGEVLKYIARAPHKHKKLEDLRKAAWYLNHTIELIEDKENQASTEVPYVVVPASQTNPKARRRRSKR